jgi:hypothetical protein
MLLFGGIITRKTCGIACHFANAFTISSDSFLRKSSMLLPRWVRIVPGPDREVKEIIFVPLSGAGGAADGNTHPRTL